MSYEFHQIPVNGSGEATEALNRSLRGGRIVGVRKEFVANGENSFWAFCVERVEATGGHTSRSPSSNGSRAKIDYKEVLSEEDFAVYSRLREVRKALAEKEAVLESLSAKPEPGAKS